MSKKRRAVTQINIVARRFESDETVIGRNNERVV